MGDFMEKQTIIQQIQPNCDNLYKNIKEAANAQHKTHRDIVENTGVARSTIAKFLSGALSNPGVFVVSALCIYLGLSLDDLMGITVQPDPADDNAVEIAELKGKIATAEAEVKLLKERCKIYDNGIAERKPIIYGLEGLCIFLSIVFAVYLFVDVSDTEHGFIRNNSVSPAIAVIILAIVVTALWTAHMVAKRKIAIKKEMGKENDRTK